MKNNKFFILLFNYISIQLFAEINGKITNIDFANGQNKLSNCITFSFDKEDLEFVPDGNPFEVSQNPSFSDYLDFAGYHFDAAQAIEAIITSIIENKLIARLSKNDDIFIYFQTSHYESDDSTTNSGSVDISLPERMNIKGHNVYSYDADVLFNVCAEYILKVVGSNMLIGYPFMSIFYNEIENGTSLIFAPTMERNIREKVLKQYPLQANIPEKLLRNVSNKIITSKLLGLPLPKEAIYQNRIVDLAKTNLSKHFDIFLKEVAKFFLEKTDKSNDGLTFIFDYGMHPVIKESFLSCIEQPIFLDEQGKEMLTAFLLRNMVIQRTMNNDPIFKHDAIGVNKRGTEKTFVKYGNTLYFDPTFIFAYIKHYKKNNVLSNLETKELEALCHSKLRDSKHD